MTNVKYPEPPHEAELKAGKAVEAFRDLRAQLTEQNPAYAAAVELENAAEGFCRDVRAALREQRKAQGRDQAEVAALLDMTQSAVSKIETGEGDLGLKSVFRYARALGLIPVCVLQPDNSQLFAEDSNAARVARELQTAFVKETSKAMASAVAEIARAVGEKEA
jgi:transcriptional regulator with XRE-family HTH domain